MTSSSQTALSFSSTLLLASGLLLGCGDEASPPEPPAQVVADTALLSAESLRLGEFTLAEARSTEWRDAWQVPGRITFDPGAAQRLGSLVEGRVLELRGNPGDQVKGGAVLAVIVSRDVIDAREALARAKAEAIAADSSVATLRAAAARAERLLAAKAMAQADLERTRASLAAAEASVSVAYAARSRAIQYLQHLLGDTAQSVVNMDAALVRAPFDGVITSREVEPGQVVTPGQSLITIARSQRLVLLLTLPEAALASIAVGEQVIFRVPAWPERTLTAIISRITPVVTAETGTVVAYATIPAEFQGLLRAEMSAGVELPGAAVGQTLTVPTGAIQVMENDTVVVIANRIGEGMLIEARPVRLGRRNSRFTEILSGISVGDSVVNQGAALAKAEIIKRRSGLGEDS